MKSQSNNRPENRELAEEWFARAGEDELSARSMLEDRRGAPGTICFLSQQMAEKYLKGYLVYRRKRFPKIHQLDRLVKMCQELDADFKEIKEEAALLSAFYVTARYPGDYPQFTFEDADRAFESACRVKDCVFKKIR